MIAVRLYGGDSDGRVVKVFQLVPVLYMEGNRPPRSDVIPTQAYERRAFVLEGRLGQPVYVYVHGGVAEDFTERVQRDHLNDYITGNPYPEDPDATETD